MESWLESFVIGNESSCNAMSASFCLAMDTTTIYVDDEVELSFCLCNSERLVDLSAV